jgi:hypothetical protein
MNGTEIGLALSVFMACTVEAVEALTIVLAVGATRSWSSALSGVAAAALALAVLVNAVERPDIRESDPAPGRERFYRRDLDPRRWLRVVVDFNESPGFVVTAFVQDQEPEDVS